MPRFTGKTRITGKTTEILERPKDFREINMLSTMFMLSNVLTCSGRKVFCMFIVNIILTF